MIRETIVKVLQEDASLVPLVSGRVWSVVMGSDATLPAIVVQTVTSPKEQGLEGPHGYAGTLLDVTCYHGTSPKGASDIATAARLVLDVLAGTFGGQVINGVEVEDESDGYDDTIRAYQSRLQVLVMHNE